MLTKAEAEYVLWREGQLPMLENSHIVLLKNTSGVDRGGHLNVFLRPTGSTDQSERVSVGTIPPDTRTYAKVYVPLPDAAGEYELVPTANDGTEYGRIPLSFASRIDPVWQGAREIETGGILDAYWAGPSCRGNLFRFEQEGRVISRHALSAMAGDDGFRLQALDVAGLYDLVFLSEVRSGSDFKSTSLGQIAVGIPFPQDDAATDVALPPDPDTAGMAEEAEAMGGEDGPQIETGAARRLAVWFRSAGLHSDLDAYPVQPRNRRAYGKRWTGCRCSPQLGLWPER